MMKTLRLLLCFCALVLGPLCTGVPAANAQPASPTTSSRATADEKNVLVYPNPSTGIVHIDINGFNGRKTELRILNVIGSVIYRESLIEFNGRFTKTLDLSRFASGLYYVKLESDNASEMRKLVIR